MGCYSFDTIFRVLKLEHPLSVEASGSIKYVAEGTAVRAWKNEETYPRASLVHYEFGPRGDMPPVDLYWYDGGLRPKTPEEWDSDRSLPREGLLLVGEKGKILCGFNGGSPRLLPKSKMETFQKPAKTLLRSIGHYEEWIEACRGQGTPAANFGFAGKVTETILLGNVAFRAGLELAWDPVKLVAGTADPTLIDPPYRKGWNL